MLSPQEQLARYEKNNRRMFLVGCFFVLLVVAFWIIAAINSEDISRILLIPGHEEQQILGRLKAAVPSPTLKEKMLLNYCEMLVIIPMAVTKVFTLRFITTLTLILGTLTIGFSQYVKIVLKVASEALEKK